MGNMLAALFSALSSFFLAMQGFGRAAQNMSDWADQATGTFVDEAKADREIKLLENRARRVRALSTLKEREGEYLKDIETTGVLPAPAASATVTA